MVSQNGVQGKAFNLCASSLIICTYLFKDYFNCSMINEMNDCKYLVKIVLTMNYTL